MRKRRLSGVMENKMRPMGVDAVRRQMKETKQSRKKKNEHINSGLVIKIRQTS